MTEDTLVKPAKLTYEQIVSDLSSVPINQADPLFNTTHELPVSDEIEYDKLEKLIVFKSTLENEKTESDVSLERSTRDLDFLDKRIDTLQNFVDISKKFMTISK